MGVDYDDMDPLRINEWFKRPYSVPVTILMFFLLLLYPAWLYLIDWFHSVMIYGLTSKDLSFIKALSFILMLMVGNVSYMILSKNVSLSRTVGKQEVELQLMDEKFRKFMDNVPNVAIQGFDENHIIHYWNSASENMYGYPRAEAIGKTITDLIVPGENFREFIGMINTTRIDPMMERFCETTFITKDGSIIPVFASYSSVQLPEDNMSIFSMEIDLTERKMMEEELMASRDLAEASNNAKSQFLANISHELRTPLNSIIGFSDMLMEGYVGSLNEKQNKYAERINSSGNNLLTMINDLLDLSKAEAGKMELNCEKVDIPLLLQEVSEFMDASSREKGITIDISIASEVGVIEADYGKLKQVFYNLVGNAIKFSPENGHISIRSRVEDDHLEFEVEDSGIGIREEDMDKLFKPFSQVDPSSNNKYAGTGLGLSLVKKFVEVHGGDVWVKSEYGEFSIFGFSIPI